MTHLTLMNVSGDGKRLLLVSDKGVEFTLDIDDKLRAALRGDPTRFGQLEIKMDATLRPRDIQARIRAGETPESVASAAQTTVEAIMPYAAPVLAERQHIAERAQRSSVRRSGPPSQGARTLGEAVTGHLRASNIDPDSVDWDAARREDGRWNLIGHYDAAGRTGQARFTFDPPGNYVVLDNDDARWLVGDLAEESAAPAPGDDLTEARSRRLSAVTDPDQLPLGHGGLGDDAVALVSEDDRNVGADDYPLGAESPVEAYLDDETPTTEQAPVSDAPVSDPAESAEPSAAQGEPDEPPVRPKRKGRSSVPSWDEILFGSGKD
jgi:hypothetical protein